VGPQKTTQKRGFDEAQSTELSMGEKHPTEAHSFLAANFYAFQVKKDHVLLSI